jgi:hypothetical protein
MPRVRSQVVGMLEHLHQLREEIHSLNDSLKNVSLCDFVMLLNSLLGQVGDISEYIGISIT